MRGICIFVLLLLASTLSNAQSDQVRVLKIFDAQGRVVGPLETYQLKEGVYLRFGNAAVFMPVRHKKISQINYSLSEFEWDDSTFTNYVTTDCSGPPLIYQLSNSPNPIEVVRTGVDVTAYIAGSGYSSKQTTNSNRSFDGVCYQGTRTMSNFWTPQKTFGLTQHYPEPLSIHY